MQKIEEAAEKGELDELVLMVIRNRLDLARCDVSNTLFLTFSLRSLMLLLFVLFVLRNTFPFLVVYISFHSHLTALTA